MEEILSGVEAVDRLIDELMEAIETTYTHGGPRDHALHYAGQVRIELRRAVAK